MLVHDPNIAEKKYQKLTLQVSPEGFSFATTDTLQHQILSYKDVAFDISDRFLTIENHFANAFGSHPELSAKYDEVAVIHNSTLSTFVPDALFDENFLGSYLQYNVKIFETDSFAYDEIGTYQMKAVYVPYADINNVLIDHFGAFDYRHAHTILVSKLLEASKNNDDKRMFVHFSPKHFEIVIVQNQRLLLFNSFEYKTPEDFLYYLLFTAEQLNLNPENFQLGLLGDISEESEFYKLAYRYIRNISLYDVSQTGSSAFSDTEKRSHFVLFHS